MHLGKGQLFGGRFEIETIIGMGGMGAVYRAQDHYTGTLVALKLLHATRNLSDDIERFYREAELLSELRHPGIVNYVAHGLSVDGQH